MNTPIAPFTAQQVFDKVLFALRAQGRAAVDSNNKCVYRAPNGDKCAFGHWEQKDFGHPYKDPKDHMN